jgi:hypothetical protein
MQFKEKKLQLLRKGDLEKVKFLETLHLKILPQHIKRIQQNDKSVLKELVLPKWVTWDLLFEWANSVKPAETLRRCALCDNFEELGIEFKEKWICQGCFLKLKEL